MITNTNFEQDPTATNSYFFRETKTTGETGVAVGSWAIDQSRSATHSLKIVSTYTNPLSYSRWMSNNTAIPAVPGRTYDANCWIRTTSAVTARFRITYWNGVPGAGGVYISDTKAPDVTGTQTSFVQRTLSGTSPAGTTYIRVEFMLYGSGTVWFDDVTFSDIVPTITVTNPNIDTVWQVRNTYNITWTSTAVNNVNIDLLQNGTYLYSIASAVPNTGTYSWTIPDQESLSNLKIRVTDSANPLINDTSDAEFSIIKPFISLIYPNGSESFRVGNTYQLRWSSAAVDDVRIELIDGIEVTTIASTPNLGVYSWTVPVSQIPGSQYKIRVVSIADETIKDESNGNFSISPNPLLSSITLISPNGGESWQAGGLSQTITWSWSGDPGPVRIELMEGLISSTIITSTPNTGSYSWTIPSNQNPATNYRIRVSSILDQTINDSSDNDFSIINPCPTPESGFSFTPNGLSIQFHDSSTNNPISWSWDFGDGLLSTEQNPVHEYSVAGPYNVTLIAQNLCGTGTISTQSVVATITPPPPQTTSQSKSDNTVAYAVIGIVGLYFTYKLVTSKPRK